MKRNYINCCALMLGLSLALSAIPTFAAKESNDINKSREQLLDEAIQILDNVELNYPHSQSDVTKIKHNLLEIKNLSALDSYNNCEDENLNYSLSGGCSNAISRANKNQNEAFYRSCDLENSEVLRAQLRDQISKMKSIDYDKARKLVFLEIDNHGGNVECVYTGKVVEVKEQMPPSKTWNIEHTWPQSMGATGAAKSDLHHLFPTDSKANAYRSSLPFGNCDDKYIKFNEGGSRCDGSCFEVRKQHRGNVARAIFYFAVRYNKSIDKNEESVLRQWHKEDPVDACELSRNDAIEAVQKNRNPFIDHPEYVDLIKNF